MSVYTFYDGQYVSLLILVACEQEAFKRAVFGQQHKVNGNTQRLSDGYKEKARSVSMPVLCQLYPLDLNSSQSTLPRSLR